VSEPTDADFTIIVPISAMEDAQSTDDDDLLKEVVASFCEDPAFNWDNIGHITISHQPLQAICIFELYLTSD